jgi:DNA processing protein
MTIGTTAMTERTAWIALASTPGVGDVTFGRLLAVHGSARAALAWAEKLPHGRGDRTLARALQTRLRPGVADALSAAARDPDRVSRQMAALGGWLLTPLDAAYPVRLSHIEEPPLVLYGTGEPRSITHDRMVAVVGTRRPTAVGRHLASSVGARLAEAGATVVSGLAIGIDGAAHSAALEHGGPTVAVVGGGLDLPGPAPHRELARQITGHGAVISELAPGVKPTHGTFPRRNRIISGLASATIVVEAPTRSGALITARHALEQGRQLLVAPGRPQDPRVAGGLALLRESPARPLVGLDEMIVDLGLDHAASASRDEGPTTPAALTLEAALDLLEPTQRGVATALASGPQSVDALCRATALDPGVVAACLTMLQMRGWARVLGATQMPAGPLVRLDNEPAA